jgi:hypothetical protein
MLVGRFLTHYFILVAINIANLSFCSVSSLSLVPKRDEVTGGWRGLHNEEFLNLHLSSSQIIKSGRMT